MRCRFRRNLFTSGFLIITLLGCGPQHRLDLLIINAQIIDVETGTTLPDQVIGIVRDTIRFVTDRSEQSAFDAETVIDAAGQFVMPGLWDNHVHFRGGDTLIAENKNLLPLFLAHGVTTVRDAGGDMTAAVMDWRSAIQKGRLAGPHIFTSGPKLDGDQPAWPGSLTVTNEEEAVVALDSLESIGVDYVKIYDGNLSKEAYYAIIAETRNRGLKVTGHMPLTAHLLEAVELGLDGSEHLYYPMEACSPLEDSLTLLGQGYGMMAALAATYDPDLADMVFQKLASRGFFVTPTLHIGTVLAEVADADHSSDSLLTYIGSGIQQTYAGRVRSAKRAKAAGNNSRSDLQLVFHRMIRPLQDAGVNLLAGSDCGPYNSYVYPGASLQEELIMLVQQGLTPQEALQASVINGPKFFGLDEFYGGVAVGKRADLILLSANPLEDIENIRELEWVIAGGRVYDLGALSALVEEIVD